MKQGDGLTPIVVDQKIQSLLSSVVNLNVIKIIFKSLEIFYGLCWDESDRSEGLTNISITEIKPDYFNYFRFGTGAW